ncbi:unnamed protein product [Orchesella dallaii]|uniref:Zonadhesin n=1 Tax=Orchesella dallaii TaxID=48710 RepID=A0ABP1R4W4_9HEXA
MYIRKLIKLISPYEVAYHSTALLHFDRMLTTQRKKRNVSFLDASNLCVIVGLWGALVLQTLANRDDLSESSIDGKCLEQFKDKGWSGHETATDYNTTSEYDSTLGGLVSTDGVWVENNTNDQNSVTYFTYTFDASVICDVTSASLSIRYYTEMATAYLYPCGNNDNSEYCYLAPPTETKWSNIEKQLLVTPLSSNKIEIAGILLQDGYVIFDEVIITHNGIVGGDCVSSSTTVATTSTDITTTSDGTEETDDPEITPTTEPSSTTTEITTTDSTGSTTTEEPEQSEPPESTTTEASTPESTTTEASTPEGTTTEAVTPESTTTEASTTEGTTTEAATPESTTAEASTPESTTTEAATPESTTTEASTPESTTTEVSTIDASTQETSTEGTTGFPTVTPTTISSTTNSESTLSTSPTFTTLWPPTMSTTNETPTTSYLPSSGSSSSTLPTPPQPSPSTRLPTSTAPTSRDDGGLSFREILLYIVLPTTLGVAAFLGTVFYFGFRSYKLVGTWGKGTGGGTSKVNAEARNVHHDTNPLNTHGPPPIPQQNFNGPSSGPIGNTPVWSSNPVYTTPTLKENPSNVSGANKSAYPHQSHSNANPLGRSVALSIPNDEMDRISDRSSFNSRGDRPLLYTGEYPGEFSKYLPRMRPKFD